MIAFLLSLALLSPRPQDAYLTPPQAVVDLVAADPTPSVSFSPDAAWLMMVERDAMPSIEVVGRPLLRLAGVRIDPETNARFASSYSKGLVLRHAGKRETVRIPVGDSARIANVTWSHDSKHFAYVLATDAGSELWLGSVDASTAPVRVSDRLNTVLISPKWMPSGTELLFAESPEALGEAPTEARRPAGPNVRESRGSKSPLRTYQDLLSSQHDEALFKHYATVQLVVANADQRTEVGAPGLFMSASPSPTGERFLVSTLEQPFSYVMPYYRFPHSIQVWDSSGKPVHTVAKVPLGDGIPIGGVRQGPRNVTWSPSGSLVWVEALDGGDPKAEVPHRDQWYESSPDGSNVGKLMKVEHRASGLAWLQDGVRTITSEFDRDRRWTRSILHDRSKASEQAMVIEDRSVRDRYGDPGRLVTKRDENGFARVALGNGRLWRRGSGASPEGSLPFLDSQDLATGETERLWRCEPGSYESVVHVHLHADQSPSFITRHETPDSPPNYRFRGGSSPAFTPMTDFPDPTPQARAIKKELVTYARPDGVPLSGTLYLPADHTEGERLPLFIWAYPIEFNDASTAGQIGGSPSRFTRIRGSSHLALVTQGYAVLDGATMPIIGDAETMNDTFVEQIVAASQAAIDYCVDRGVADRDRVAVGGHSYGAFMTANLLAHCDLFKAGIARSGAYNRTLTPFGFQSERRTIWEATDAYIHISPFFAADRIDEPLLLIHGEVDNNSGTYPMQSERLFAAIQGNGGTARLCMLPYESHGYRAMESVLHVHAEMIAWLDEHVKGATPVEAGFEK